MNDDYQYMSISLPPTKNTLALLAFHSYLPHIFSSSLGFQDVKGGIRSDRKSQETEIGHLLWKGLSLPCMREKKIAVERQRGWGKGKMPHQGQWREFRGSVESETQAG